MAKEVVQTLINKGIRLLALDFDKTLVTVHTAGYWRGGSPQLAEHIRPCFQAMMIAALEQKLHTCIVTYSSQAQLIHDVLRLVLPKSDISKIMIRANTKEWCEGLDTSAVHLGKEQHIAWCVTELYDQKHEIIQPYEVLLMDDDSDNVAIALQFGHQAYEVKEDVNLENIKKFVNELELKRNSPIQ